MTRYFPARLFLILLLAMPAAATIVSAQQTSPLGPLEPSDTSSPAATLAGLIESCNELDRFLAAGPVTEERDAEILPTVERVLDCLDISELPRELRLTAGLESALFLKEILDRIELPEATDIPEVGPTEEGESTLTLWQIPGSRLAIGRLVEGPRRNQWVFTAETVRNAARYYRIVNDLPYRDSGWPVSPGLYNRYSEATKQRPTLTADTSSPRGTLTMFVDSCNELYGQITEQQIVDRTDPRFLRLGQQIISCLDTSQLPEYAREYFDAEAAVCLKEVLDRILLPSAEDIPGVESVDGGEGGEPLTRWQIPRSQIVIARIDSGPRRGEFLFSSETVGRAPELYRKHREQPYRVEGRPVSAGFYNWWLSRPGNPAVASLVDRLPDWFQTRVLGIALWQWVGLGVSTPLAIALLILLVRLGRTVNPVSRAGSRVSLIRYWLAMVFPLMGLLIPVAFKHLIYEYVTLRGQPLYIANFCADVVFLLASMVLVVRLSSRIAESIVALPSISPAGLDASVIRIICRVLGIAAAVILFLEGGRYLGFPITTLIASAGIGGLAIALSAQGLVKGLFGTVTVLLDRPYRAGDLIMARGHEGVVQEIGLRSTKILAMDGRLISIPNDLLAEAEVQNIGSNRYLRRKSDIRIPLDTPRKQIEQALQLLRDLLQDHEGMDPAMPPRVFFSDFNADSFNITVTFWYSPPDIGAFKEFSQKVNLEIMRVFEEHGIQFSLPFRHTFWKHDNQQGPLDVVVRQE
jgi:MscS family membrane protein